MTTDIRTKQPVVSVIMAVFNGERHLPEAIDSVLRQTFNDLELLVVNDGSTDGTQSILQSYADPRLRVINSTSNRGLTRCLNHALRDSTGVLVARQDADDVSVPDRIRRQVDFLNDNAKVAGVGTWATQIDEDGEDIGVLRRFTEPARIKAAITKENQFLHGSVMLRRSILDQVGGYREYFKYAQDYDLFLRIIAGLDMANIPEPLYKKRHAPHALSIIHAGEQKSFSGVARKLYLQRIQRGSDDLDEGREIGHVVEETGMPVDPYEKSLIYLYLRSDRYRKARPYILKKIRATPFRFKHYLQYAMTFLSKGLLHRLVRLWDHQH